MIKERRGQACAIRNNVTYVIGGEWSTTRNSMELWDGSRWTYSEIEVGDAYMEGGLLLHNTKLYLFTSWGSDLQWRHFHKSESTKGGEIWEIDERNKFRLYGNMPEPIREFTVFTIPYNYNITNCKGL